MKRLKLFFACLLMAVLSIGQVWGSTEETITLSNGSFSTDHIDWSGTSCTVSQTKGTSSTAVNSSYISAPRVYKGHVLSFVAKTNYKIDSIKITVSGTNYGNSMTAGTAISSGTVTDNTTAVSRSWTSTSGGTHVIKSVNSSGLSAIYIQNVASSTNVQLRPTSIKVYYTSSSTSPSVVANPTSLNFGSVEQNASVAGKTFSVTGSNLTGAITIAAPTGYSVNPTSITPSNGAITATNVTVTPVTTNQGTFNGNVTISGGGLTSNVTVGLTMTVTPPFDGEVLEIKNTDFATSYTNANGDHELGCITITSYQVGNYSSSIQFQKNTGYIYNKTALGEIAKIEITKTGNNNLDVYEGTEENPTTTKITGVAVENVTTYTFSSGKSYFRIFCNNTAASNVTPIKVYYHPTSHAVTLSAGSNGSLTATVDAAAIASGDNVEMCKTVAITATPNTGYKIKSLTVTDEDDDEVEVTNNEFVMPAKAVTIAATFEAAKTLTGIEITNPATQTTFWQGVPFNYDGLEVTAHFDGAADEIVTPTSVTGSTATAGENLTVTVSYTEGTTETAEYTINVKAVPSTAEAPYTVAEARSLYDAYDAASIEQPSVYVKGVVTSATLNTTLKNTAAVYNGSYNVFVKDVGTDGSVTYEFYRMWKDNTSASFEEGDIVVGDTLVAYGTLDMYSTTYEFSAGCYMVDRKAYAAPKVDISNDQEHPYTVAQAIALIDDLSSDLTKTVFVQGVVTSVSGNNIFIKDAETDGSVTFEFYNCVDVTGVEENDTIIGTGTMKKFNSIYEFNSGCEVVEIKKYVAPLVPSISAEPVAVDAAAHAGQSVTITYENWGTVNVYETEATLWNNEACDEAFSGEWITNVAVAANNESVSFDIAANTGEARTAYMKIYALGDDNGTTEAEKVITISQEVYVAPALPAALPFAFDGGRADIANTQGMSAEGLGSDYSGNAPKLKFDGTGDWVIIEIDSDPGKLTYDIKGNTFSDGTFTVQQSEDGIVYADLATYTEFGSSAQSEEKTLAQTTRFVKFIYTEKVNGNVGLGNIAIAAYVAPAPVETPTISGEESFLNSTTITLACETDGATIYYTIDGSDPKESTTTGTSFTLTESATVRAIAKLGDDWSNEATPMTFTKIEALATMDAIFAAATTAGSTPADVYVTFDNWVVSGIKGSNAFVTDGTKGFVIYASSHGFVVGNILSGTAACKVQLYKGSAELTTLTSSTTGLTVTTGGTVTATPKTIDQLGAINTGALVTIENLSYNGTNLSDGTHTINPYNGLYNGMSFEDGKDYNVTGVVNYYDALQIMPRGAADIEEIIAAGAPETPTFSPAGGEYTEAQNVTISCATEGAVIYYTIDGSTPTNGSTAFTSAISVAQTMTIKAIAIKDDKSSAMATAIYTINIPEDESVSKTWDLSKASYDANPTADQVTWSATYVSMVADKNNASTAANNYLGGDANNRTSSRFYSGSTLTITPNSKEITSVVFTATSTNYANALQGSEWTNATASVNGSTVTVTPTDGKIAISAAVGGTCGFSSVQVNYKNITPEPQYTDIRTGLTAGNYYTLCYPKAMTAIQGGTLWSFAGKDASTAYLVQEEAPFVAGRPYIIYAESDKLEAVLEGDDAAAGNYNGLYGTLDDMSNSELLTAGATHMLKNNELRPVGDGHLAAQRAYIKLADISAPSLAPGRNIRKMPLQQEVVTGIDALNASEAPVKMMIDGQLFILRGEKMYNANGQLVK